MSSSREEVRVVATTTFDDIELFSRPFPTKEAAEAFVREQQDDEVASYTIEGDVNARTA